MNYKMNFSNTCRRKSSGSGGTGFGERGGKKQDGEGEEGEGREKGKEKERGERKVSESAIQMIHMLRAKLFSFFPHTEYKLSAVV